MTRKPIIAGNWKMNNGIGEAVVLAQEISNLCERDYPDAVDIIVIPPFVDIKPVNGVFEFDKCEIMLGAQNCYFMDAGAYTGEISIPMIAEAGCEYCLVGHSERRDIFGEDNALINNKVRALFEWSGGTVKPILCVGESLAVRDEGTYLEYICKQIEAGLAGIEVVNADQLVIAYEPIWAIGTGRTATPKQAEEVIARIRELIGELYGNEISDGIRILYGGSMNEGNVDALLEQPNIDGGLIGGASLKADSFISFIKSGFEYARK